MSRRQLRQDGGGTPRDGPTSETRAHGYTAGISIGVLMPATAIIARNFRVRHSLSSNCAG